MPEDEEKTPVRKIATCRTSGCAVEGEAFETDLFPNVDPPTFRASCGHCGQAPELTDPPA